MLENVLVPAELAGTRRAEAMARARSLLQAFDLTSVSRSFPSRLSGGQRQRVAIARALINQPALVLADEPTGALDSQAGAVVMDVLEEINRQGQTILLVTHDAKLATRHGRRVVTLRDGRVAGDTRLRVRREARPVELVQVGAEGAQ